MGALVLLVTLPGGADAAASRTTTVRMGDFFYAPKVVRVKVGQKVRFVNAGRIDHTVADVNAKGAILGRAIKPKLLAIGDVQVVTFRKAGIAKYLCTLHPTRMGGTVVVLR